MRHLLFILSFCVYTIAIPAQEVYFPPIDGNEWETIEPGTLGYCEDSIAALYSFLELSDTKAFLLLKDGKIVLEKYFGEFQQDSLWYWASAGKTLTSFLIGIAQNEGDLNIEDPTNQYLGKGWTSLTSEREEKIEIRHQLSMTTGLDDVSDGFCTDPECLTFKAEPGMRWAYHNAPYTLLTSVLEAATGTNYNVYTFQKLKNPTGMDGFWIKLGYNRVFFSTARSMARFGLLALNKGSWSGVPVLQDTTYFNEMVNPSQDINESYGYLWWLNGYESFRIPQSQLEFNGPLVPQAPADAYFGLGANAQILSVVPSENLVVVRLGHDPGSGLVSLVYLQDLWTQLNALRCSPSSTDAVKVKKFNLYPNPSNREIRWEETLDIERIEVYNSMGQMVLYRDLAYGITRLHIGDLPPSIYKVKASTRNATMLHSTFVKHK